MNNLIDHGLNYVRFALLGIATAFLIIPFNVHAGGGVEQYNLPDLPILSFKVFIYRSETMATPHQ